MPGAGRTHGPPATKNAGGSYHRQGRNIPAFPARWFYGLYVRSPESGLVSLRPPGLLTRGLIPASGDQDYTNSPSGSMLSSARQARCTSRRPPHPFLNVRDDRETPLCEDGMRGENHKFR
jgi:hypothetical protein